MENKTAYHINKKREVYIRTGCDGWIKITKKQILALAEEVKDKDYICTNYNIEDLGKKYKTK